MQMSNFLAAILLFVGMGFESLMTVCAQYVENNGVKWYIVLVFGEWIFFLCLIVYWITVYSYKFINISNNNNNNNISYFGMICSVFPDFSDKWCWIMLLLRGICGSISLGCYMISLYYIDSGDAVLLQNVSVSVCSIILGKIFFGEKFNKFTLLALVLCIIGIILVCQPKFLFLYISKNINDIDYEPVSSLGFLFSFLSGIALLMAGLITKHSKSLQLEWLSLALMAAFISSISSIVIFLFEYYYFDSDINSTINNSTVYNDEIMWLLVSIGVLICLFIVFYTISYQYGNVSQLGLILNSDIIITYILQVFVLNESKNWMGYLGVAIIAGVCVLIFINEAKQQEQEQQQQQEETTTSKIDNTLLQLETKQPADLEKHDKNEKEKKIEKKDKKVNKLKREMTTVVIIDETTSLLNPGKVKQETHLYSPVELDNEPMLRLKVCLSIVCSIVCGIVHSTQIGVNGLLAIKLNNAVSLSVFVSFFVSTIILLVFLCLNIKYYHGSIISRFEHLFCELNNNKIEYFCFIDGILFSFCMTAGVFISNIFGLSLYFVLFVCGQVVYLLIIFNVFTNNNNNNNNSNNNIVNTSCFGLNNGCTNISGIFLLFAGGIMCGMDTYVSDRDMHSDVNGGIIILLIMACIFAGFGGILKDWINARLEYHLESGYFSNLISMVGATFWTFIMALIEWHLTSHDHDQGLKYDIRNSRLYYDYFVLLLSPGILGSIIVCICIISQKYIGYMGWYVCYIFGNLTTSLIYDSYGVFNDEMKITGMTSIGIMFVCIAVVVCTSPQLPIKITFDFKK